MRILLLLPLLLFLSCEKKKPSPFEEYLASKYYKVMHKSEEILGHKIGPPIAEQYQLKFLKSDVGILPKGSQSWDFFFMSRQPMTEEEASLFLMDVHGAIIAAINKDPDVAVYVNKDDHATEAIPEKISLRITFWDEEYDRIKPPYVAEANYHLGQFIFRMANPETDALVPQSL